MRSLCNPPMLIALVSVALGPAMLSCGGKSGSGATTTTPATAPATEAEMPGAKLFERRCTTCHVGGSRKGPEIVAGYNSRVWIRGFLQDPSGDKYYGRTRINEMEPVTSQGAELDALVEFVYAQSGAADVNAELAATGQALFDDGDCSNCHSHDYTTEGDVGPNLGKRGTVEMFAEFIADPGHPRWFGDKNQMPKFGKKLDPDELRAIAEYLVWLRDAE